MTNYRKTSAEYQTSVT